MASCPVGICRKGNCPVAADYAHIITEVFPPDSVGDGCFLIVGKHETVGIYEIPVFYIVGCDIGNQYPVIGEEKIIIVFIQIRIDRI